MRVRNVLTTFSEFDPDDLALTPQEFEDYKSKYLDLAQGRGDEDGGEGGEGGGDPEPSPLDDIDFELELIRHDEINVAYILALLIAFTTASRAGGAGSERAEEQRRRIFDLLVSEAQLRNKREAIERFIDHRLPMLGPEDDIRAAFAEFWSEERDRSYADLCAREDLEPAGVERLVRTIVFTGKRPMAAAVVEAMNTKPGILSRRSAIERVLAGIEDIIATFDDGIGDLDE